MTQFGLIARRFAVITVACMAGLIAAGTIFAEATGRGLRTSVAIALLVGGGLLIVANALGSGGTLSGGVDVHTGMTFPDSRLSSQGSLAWMLVGVVLVGFGAL